MKSEERNWAVMMTTEPGVTHSSVRLWGEGQASSMLFVSKIGEKEREREEREERQAHCCPTKNM